VVLVGVFPAVGFDARHVPSDKAPGSIEDLVVKGFLIDVGEAFVSHDGILVFCLLPDFADDGVAVQAGPIFHYEGRMVHVF